MVMSETTKEVVAGLTELMKGPSARLQSFGFATTSMVIDPLAPLPVAQPLLTGRALLRVLSARPHFIVPLRKRALGAPSLTERISVGRARNNDIVLRHPSVSKFHAWLEVDDENTFYIAAGDSTNPTTLNGRRLTSTEVPPLHSGDVLMFGDLEALFCDAKVLWEGLVD
jgi:hypothetical protein